jgi:hypothetical protein
MHALIPPEKALFVLAVLSTGYFALRVVERIVRILRRGQGQVDWGLARKRLFAILVKVGSLQPTFRLRFWVSLFHALVAWAFMVYLLVNLGDILEAFFPNLHSRSVICIG